MADLERPKSIKQAIEGVCALPWDYAAAYRPKCVEIARTWHFDSGNIAGPVDSAPDGWSNEQWINQWMDELYDAMNLRSILPDTYYRFTTKEEYIQANKGIFRVSKNYRKGLLEAGKSVARGPFLTYFAHNPFAYLLKGDLLSMRCSDGAPLLEINENLQVASELKSPTTLLYRFYDCNRASFNSVAQSSGVSEIDLFNLSLGIWFNYHPGQ